MQYILDLVILISIALFVYNGVKNGFVKGFIEFIGSIISLLLAAWSGSIISQYVYENFIKESVIEQIADATNNLSVSEGVSNVFKTMPSLVVRFFDINNITESSVLSAVQSQNEAIADSVEAIFAPVYIGIINIFAVIVMLILFMIVVAALAKFVDGVFSLPILDSLNKLFGGATGLLMGCIIVFMIISIISFFEPMIEVETASSFESLVESSIVTNIMVEANPLNSIFS